MMPPLLRYLTTMCDPLTPIVQRIEAQEAAVGELSDQPARGCLWFATMIRTFVRALPPADPWRRLGVCLPGGLRAPEAAVVDALTEVGSSPDSAESEDPDRPDGTRQGLPPLPPVGAVAAGRRFGTVEDHWDLVPRGAEDIGEDSVLGRFAAEFPLPSSLVLAAAGWYPVEGVAATCLQVIELTEESGGFVLPGVWVRTFAKAGADRPGGSGFYLLSEALQRALYRYRCYVGDLAVSSEAPQLALEVTDWVSSLTLPSSDDLLRGPDPKVPGPAGLAAVVARFAGAGLGDHPTLHGFGIPDTAYDEFRIL